MIPDNDRSVTAQVLDNDRTDPIPGDLRTHPAPHIWVLVTDELLDSPDLNWPEGWIVVRRLRIPDWSPMRQSMIEVTGPGIPSDLDGKVCSPTFQRDTETGAVTVVDYGPQES
ncbi:MAG TPA: hypothetical protein VHA75_00910 [Rugosimonospora sp.]|nr:hypothetical protein [Rugosimonospora sp.]